MCADFFSAKYMFNLNVQTNEFLIHLNGFAHKNESELSKRLRNEIKELNINLLEFDLSENNMKSIFLENKNYILPYILVAHMAGQIKLPHVQYCFISFIQNNKYNDGQLESWLKNSIELFTKFFPFINEVENLIDYLRNKYCSDCNTRNINTIRLLNAKSIDNLFNKNIEKKLINDALLISIEGFKKFGDNFLFRIMEALTLLKATNDCLKVLIIATFRKPLALSTLMLWGNVSINLASTRSYWLAKLASLIYPENPGVLLNLSGNVSGIGAYSEAKKSLELAYRNTKGHYTILINYANLLASEGRPELAVKMLERARKDEPTFSGRIDSNLLFLSQYTPDVNFLQLKKLHIRTALDIVKNQPNIGFEKISVNKLPKIKKKVGFVTFDLINHPISYFLYPLIKNFKSELFELFIFSTMARKDSVTKIFMNLLDINFIDISGLTLRKTYEIIKDLQIDILIDLSGHTAGNSLALFSMSPCEVQITYLGYPFTTGLPQIKYRFSDISIPDDSFYYTETRINIADSAYCYQPMIANLELITDINYAVKPPPFINNNFITFGLSSNPAKINDNVVNLFSKVILNVKNSKLLIEASGFADLEYRQMFISRFTRHGVSPEQLIFMPRDSSLQYKIYNLIDIALDPFPYNGGTSTMDLLWMGVPLVTLKGIAGMSVMGASYLSHMNMNENIAINEQKFIEICIRLSSNRENLINKRLSQRKIMENSPLMDGIKFSKNFEKALLLAT
jgi:predicted O-linked N-acetylglucosamine transferase (SPINDLY family)